MSFFGEIADIIGWDASRLALGYSVINYNGEAVFVEGIKSVLRITTEQMAFKLPKGVLYVEGENLEISDLSGGSVIVRGAIYSVHDGRAERKTDE